MITNKSLFRAFILLFIIGCNNKEQDNNSRVPKSRITRSDTAKVAVAAHTENPKIIVDKSEPDTLSFESNKGFEADYALLKNDTLIIITTSISTLYPFGKFQHAKAILGKYPLFKATQGQSAANGQTYSYTLLRYGNSAVKFYDNEEDGATVVSGHILDKELVLQSNIGIGQTLEQVLHVYFSRINTVKLKSIHVIRVDSVVAGIKIFFNFDDAYLTDIYFDSYSVIDKSLR